MVASYLNDDRRRLDSLLCLLYSIRAQTYPHWEVLVVHDGPLTDTRAKAELLRMTEHSNVTLLEPPERKGHYGHPYRALGISHARGDHIGLSNDDNYYAPTYFEWMLHAAQVGRVQLAYCSMVHNHRQWGPIKGRPARGHIDAGSWLAAAALAKGTPWTDLGFAGDWTFFAAMLKKAGGSVHVPGHLFVHN